MADKPKTTFPGGSKKRVDKAGERIRKGEETQEDLNVVNTWREEHRHVINSFRSILRGRVEKFDSEVSIAQRLKRRKTIFDKLNRLPNMSLIRMQDVAGCRLIFDDIDSLYKFRTRIYQKHHFDHEIKHDIDRYDYIKRPKESGYRGVHDVYAYNINSERDLPRRGLLIELQYRTLSQHAWAIAVELVGLLTQHQPKFDRATKDFKMILRLASEIISRSHESMPSSLPDLSNKQIVREFISLDNKLKLMRLLERFEIIRVGDLRLEGRINILILEKDRVEIRPYKYMPSATKDLFELEVQKPSADILLVQGSEEDVRKTFQNYFGDANFFLTVMNHCLDQLKTV